VRPLLQIQESKQRLPAKELIPTKKKEQIVPMIAAHVACLNEMPNPKKKEP